MGLVSCHTSRVASARPPWSVARSAPQGMVYPIAKGRNAATGQGGRALWERTERATAALQPLAIRRVFPAGCVLQWRAPFTLMRLYLCDTTLARIFHQPSAAAAESLAVAGRTPSNMGDACVAPTMPSASFRTCAPPQRRCNALATNVGEIAGGPWRDHPTGTRRHTHGRRMRASSRRNKT